ncbi:MAG: FlgO family outer membrane protein [Motiliproteus sp.]
MKTLAVLSLISMISVGCALQSNQPVRVIVENEVRTKVVNETALAPTAERQAKRALGGTVPVFGEPVRVMAQQIEAGLKKRGIKRLPITITPFVDLINPAKRRALGTELAEGFFHELQVRGFNLIDFSALPFASKKTDKGVYPLADFYRKHRISYVLSGTYMVNSDGIIINARVLDTVTKQVVATGQSKMSASELEGGLPGYNPLDSRDGMIVENAGVPVH